MQKRKKGYKWVISIPASSCPAFPDCSWSCIELCIEFRMECVYRHGCFLQAEYLVLFLYVVFFDRRYINDNLMSERDSHLDWQFDSLAVFRWILLKTCVVSRPAFRVLASRSPSRRCSWQDKILRWPGLEFANCSQGHRFIRNKTMKIKLTRNKLHVKDH